MSTPSASASNTPRTPEQSPRGVLSETVASHLSIVESKSKNGRMVLRGEFGWVDRATENKRYYPSRLMEREITKLQKAMEARRVYGELDHPVESRTELKRVSHIITSLEITPEGKVMGEAEVLDTPAGKVLAALVKAGCQVGISSRGFGTTKATEEGCEEVQEDFQLVTYDAVADPAASTAYPEVFYEWMGSKETKMDSEKAIKEALERQEKELTAKFTAKLEQAIPTIKAEVEARMRSEAESDPANATAKVALEAVRSALSPTLLNEDAKRVVSEKDAEIARITGKLREKDAEIKRLGEENGKYAAVAKEAGFKYYLGRLLKDNPDSDLILKTIGDVQQYPSADALKTKIEAIQTVIDRRRAQEEAAKAEERKLREGYERQIADLEARNSKLEETAIKAVTVAKKQALIEYTARKTAGSSQQERAREIVSKANVSTQEEVDKLIDTLPHDADRAKNESARARVKRLNGSGYESSALAEETPAKQADYNSLGLDLEELRELSGMN